MTTMSGIESFAKCSVYRSPSILKQYPFRKTLDFFFYFIFCRQINLEALQDDFWLSKQSLTAFWFGILARQYKYLCQRSWLESWNYFRCDGVIIRRKILPRLSCLLHFCQVAIAVLLKRESWKANAVFQMFLLEDDFHGCSVRKHLHCF